ncbi:thiamine pyrophosphate-binding protein [Dyadobacter arcticus]|uniref:Acetolactate synthase-1/2/3 large subunit n=1 Tax=Dyadobacter arcticus TaxID=1078754 RepID=A0ABX0UEZ3_9BACT|nr:thiamine pyrophosphate-binding protein [Dyadobacter arcticus]NIJ51573.1 acetolactate synthase-1/2/3 large subunit [Dyadobacter arcticus]
MKVSDFIAAFIHKQGINVVFEMAGGMITHILDSIASYDDIKIVSMHHEQAASFAADAFGRVTGRPGVALATSGPGATNLLTGIGSCYFDSSPAIFITGQVNLHEQKGDLKIRQLGFQETDIATMAEPITKAVYRVKDASEIEQVFKSAFLLSLNGRPGPVLIDIPMNIQRADIEVGGIEYLDKEKNITSEESAYKRVWDQIKASTNPVILAGGGIRSSGSWSLFQEFVDTTGLPVITSLLGIDVLPRTNEHNVGFLGAYGNRWANLAIGEADLILVLGSRLDIRQTGADTGFFSTKKMIHVDCEIGELNNRIKNCHIVHEDLIAFFTGILAYINANNAKIDCSEWKDKIRDLKEAWPDVNELPDIMGINPNVFMHKVSQNAGNVSAWIADVGNHQMWAAQSLELVDGQRFLTSGGMGAMGFALPAAIGACLASRRPVVVIAGDGGFQLNIQELQTIFRNNLPIKMIVINNNNLGMIRQFQDSYFDSRYQSTFWGYSAPDFAKVANAYGIQAQTIKEDEEIESAVEWFLHDDDDLKPKLLQVIVDSYANAYPKIAFGKPLTEMEPFAKPIAMEST